MILGAFVTRELSVKTKSSNSFRKYNTKNSPDIVYLGELTTIQTLSGVLASTATKKSKKMNHVEMERYSVNIATHLPVSNVRSRGMKVQAVRESSKRNFSVSFVFQMCENAPNASRLSKRTKGVLIWCVLNVTTASAGVAWDQKNNMTEQ